jgi:hypothetical protein
MTINQEGNNHRSVRVRHATDCVQAVLKLPGTPANLLGTLRGIYRVSPVPVRENRLKPAAL